MRSNVALKVVSESISKVKDSTINTLRKEYQAFNDMQKP